MYAMYARRLSPLVLALLVVGVVSAQEQKVDRQPKIDPTGTWKWERDFNGNKIDYTLRLKRKADKLTGTYKTVFENGRPGLDEPVKIDDVKIEGDAISFTVTRSFNDNEFTISYSGKLAKDEIAGSFELDFGNGPREFPWNAKRAVDVLDVVGKWTLEFETPNGPIQSRFTLAEEEGKLSGVYHSGFFGDNPMQEIEIKDNALSFVVAFQTDNGEFSAAYKGQPRGDKITGVIVTNFGGQEMETPFEGTRAAPPKAESRDAGVDDAGVDEPGDADEVDEDDEDEGEDGDGDADE